MSFSFGRFSFTISFPQFSLFSQSGTLMSQMLNPLCLLSFFHSFSIFARLFYFWTTFLFVLLSKISPSSSNFTLQFYFSNYILRALIIQLFFFHSILFLFSRFYTPLNSSCTLIKISSKLFFFYVHILGSPCVLFICPWCQSDVWSCPPREKTTCTACK